MRGRPCLSLCVACWGVDADSSQVLALRSAMGIAAAALILLSSLALNLNTELRSGISKTVSFPHARHMCFCQLQKLLTVVGFGGCSPIKALHSSKKRRISVPSSGRLQSHSSAASSLTSDLRPPEPRNTPLEPFGCAC